MFYSHYMEPVQTDAGLEHGISPKKIVKEDALVKGNKKVYAELFLFGAVAIVGSVAYGSMR